ncbi:MAG: hypothetical protein WD751_02335 [Anaerolineales bacterium]
MSGVVDAMRIGFLLLRDTFFKTMGELIEASVERGHTALLLYSEETAGGPKAYQQVTKEKLAPFAKLGGKGTPFQLSELAQLKEKFQLDVLVTHEGYYFLTGHLKDLGMSRREGVLAVSLSHFYENIRHPLESLLYFDKTYYLSDFSVDTHFAIANGGKRREEFAGLYEASGSPMFDQLMGLKRDEARRELGIPEGKRVVVFFAPVIVRETRWRHLILRHSSRIERIKRVLKAGKWRYVWAALTSPDLLEIAQAIREFCDRNNAYLIIKSRAKQTGNDIFDQIADRYMTGENDSYYPVFTSYKLLASADLCITAMSMSALEGVATGVPVWNIYIPYSEYEAPAARESHGRQYFRAVMGRDKEGPFNYRDCVTNIDPKRVLGVLRRKSLTEAFVDPQAAREYARLFLGIKREPSSERILNSLEQLYATRPRTEQKG